MSGLPLGVSIQNKSFTLTKILHLQPGTLAHKGDSLESAVLQGTDNCKQMFSFSVKHGVLGIYFLILTSGKHWCDGCVREIWVNWKQVKEAVVTGTGAGVFVIFLHSTQQSCATKEVSPQHDFAASIFDRCKSLSGFHTQPLCIP